MTTRGCCAPLIARELATSECTIKYHLTEVFSRLGASSRPEAVAQATALGWLVLARPVHRGRPGRMQKRPEAQPQETPSAASDNSCPHPP